MLWFELDGHKLIVLSLGGSTRKCLVLSRKLSLTPSSRTTFCSHPAQACVEHINTTSTALPPLTYAFDITQEGGLPQPDVTCFDNSTLQIRGLVADPGMTYEVRPLIIRSGSFLIHGRPLDFSTRSNRLRIRPSRFRVLQCFCRV